MADTSRATRVIGNIGSKPVDKYRVWEVEWKATRVEKECGEEGTSVHQKLHSSLMKISLSTLDYSNFVTIDIGNTSWLLEKVFLVREYALYDLYVKFKLTLRESGINNIFSNVKEYLKKKSGGICEWHSYTCTGNLEVLYVFLEYKFIKPEWK